jgi:hypothetical protein
MGCAEAISEVWKAPLTGNCLTSCAACCIEKENINFKRKEFFNTNKQETVYNEGDSIF